MKRTLFLYTLCTTLWATSLMAQLSPFQSKAAFDADVSANCTTCAMAHEGFAQFADAQAISNLDFSNIQVDVSGGAEAHYGNWNYFPGCSNTFIMGALKVTAANPVTLTFSKPVYGFGGFFYDYGFPYSDISLTAVSQSNQTMTITETCPEMGDTGFMGFSAAEGITQITVSTNQGSIDMDNIAIAQLPMQTVVPIDMEIGEVMAPTGAHTCVTVSAEYFTDVKGFQHAVRFDPSMLKYEYVDLMGLPNTLMVNEIEAGVLGVSWNHENNTAATGVSFSTKATLYQLCFEVLGPEGVQCPISFSDDPVAMEFFTSAMAQLPYQMRNGMLAIGTPPQAVPTMGEWAIFLLMLLCMAIGSVFLIQSQQVGSTGSVAISFSGKNRFPFDKTSYLAALRKMIPVAALGALLIVWGWGEFLPADGFGLLCSILILAYILHLWEGQE